MPQGGWLGFLPVVLTVTIPNPSMYTFKKKRHDIQHGILTSTVTKLINQLTDKRNRPIVVLLF